MVHLSTPTLRRFYLFIHPSSGLKYTFLWHLRICRHIPLASIHHINKIVPRVVVSTNHQTKPQSSAPKRNSPSSTPVPRNNNPRLKIRLLLEKHRERDDGAVDEQATENRHDHSRNLNNARVGQHRRQRYLEHLCQQGRIVPPERSPLPIPITTRKPVRKRPRSKTPPPPLPSRKSSGLLHREQMAFGSGARQYVATTSSGK